MESGSSQVVSVESSLDFTFAFNNAKFSDRTLQLEIMPDSTLSKTDPTDSVADWALTRNQKSRWCDKDSKVHEAVQSIENQSSTDDPETQVKNIHINTAILAAKSPFFYKMFSNGMSESNKSHVTLQIQESEEAAFMDMLKFMYTNTLSSTTPSSLVDILIAADKYEVASCMKYCLRLLLKSPMTCESALLYLDLPSIISMDDAVRPLTDAAKEFLVAHFKDISKFQEEMLNLPLACIEAIISSDDLQVDSEDKIYDFIMKWAQKHCTKQSEREEILNTRLLRLIRFQYMSCDKLKELLSCTDINPKCSSELLFEALSFETPHRQLLLISHKQERAYKLRPVKVIRFDLPCEECIVYLDLKREECARLFSDGAYNFSRNFDFGGQTFYLHWNCIMDDETSVHSFGLYLGMQENKSVVSFVVEFEFSSRKKPSEEFVIKNKKNDRNFTQQTLSLGYRNLFGVPWDTFIAENSPYFINGVLHLRVVLKKKKEV